MTSARVCAARGRDGSAADEIERFDKRKRSGDEGL